MHIFFQDVRIYKRKEFFAAAPDDVERFFNMVTTTEEEQDDVDDQEFRSQWAVALRRAKKEVA